MASQGKNHQCFHGFETLNLASHGVDHALKRPLCSAQPDTGFQIWAEEARAS